MAGVNYFQDTIFDTSTQLTALATEVKFRLLSITILRRRAIRCS